MVDEAKTLAWLDTLCTVAMTEARQGNTLPAHRLGSNPATQYYFHLVHTLRSITPQQWARDYPHFLKEIDDQRQFQEQQMQALDNTGKIKLLEDENAELKAQIAALDAKVEALIVAQHSKVDPEPETAKVEGDSPAETPAEEAVEETPPAEGKKAKK